MKRSIFFYAMLIMILGSCSSQKYILKNNQYHEIITGGGGLDGGGNPLPITYDIRTSKFTSSTSGKITDKGDYLIITPASTAATTVVMTTTTNPTTGWKVDVVGKKYFPDTDVPNFKNKFQYLDGKFLLQGITIPIKIRPQLRNVDFKDSFPSQVETGFNVGFAVGWKFNYNVFKSSKNILGQNTNRYSLTPGIMSGLGATDLKKANTRNPVILFERKVPMFTLGGFMMLGFNNINIGYAFGWDYPIGENSAQWLYYGKLWHGVVIALDLIK